MGGVGDGHGGAGPVPLKTARRLLAGRWLDKAGGGAGGGGER